MEYSTLGQSPLKTSYRRYSRCVHVYSCAVHPVKLVVCPNWPHLYGTSKILLVDSWPVLCIFSCLSCPLTCISCCGSIRILMALGRPDIDFLAFCCLNPKSFTFNCWIKSISGNILHTFDVKYTYVCPVISRSETKWRTSRCIVWWQKQYKMLWVNYVVTIDINWKILELC